MCDRAAPVVKPRARIISLHEMKASARNPRQTPMRPNVRANEAAPSYSAVGNLQCAIRIARKERDEHDYTTRFHRQRGSRLGDPTDRVVGPCAGHRLAQSHDQDHRRLSRRRADRPVRTHLWRAHPRRDRSERDGGEQGRRFRIGGGGRSQARRARRLYVDVHDLDDDDHEPRADQGHPLRRRQGLRAGLDHAVGQPAVRGRREDRREEPRRVRRVCEEGREGQYRHLRRTWRSPK